MNNLKKKILIISGGISKERLISLDTGLQVAKELRKNSYNVQISEPNSNLQKIINKFNPDQQVDLIEYLIKIIEIKIHQL